MILAALLTVSCDYGGVGGADKTTDYRAEEIKKIVDPMVSVWYSHYGHRKLDGYRIGAWKDRKSLIPPAKQALFPALDLDNPRFKTPDSPLPEEDDYFVFYDDTVYEISPGDGGNGGWENLVTRYIGIVRGVNIFNDNPDTGAIIIEYLDGAYPQWSQVVQNRPLPFFGIHYRIINPNCIQMANSVDLAALAAGHPYHTETPTLEAALAQHTAERDGEFIAWGIVIPQDREP